MIKDALYYSKKKWGEYLDSYDSEEEDIGTSYLENDVELAAKSHNMILYATVDSRVKFNGSAKEIFLPAESMVPIGFIVESFNVKTDADTGKLHWQAWY